MKPILSINHLAFLLGFKKRDIKRVAKNSSIFYRPFFQSRPGRAPRRIDRAIGILEKIQKEIKVQILSQIELPDVFHGCVAGRSSETNARVHVGQKLLITLDVKSFFPSITNDMVFEAFFHRLGFSSGVARILTQLTTVDGHLPQGTHTSPLIANLVLVPAIESSKKLLEAKPLFGDSRNSQHVDDMAISGDIRNCGELINALFKEFRKYGLKLSRKKTKIEWASEPQIVTGHLVNKRVALPRNVRSRTRAAVHTLEQANPEWPEYRTLYNSVCGQVRRLKKYHSARGAKLLQRIENLPAPL